MKELIGQWGYLAVLIGAILEGESVLLLGGFAAHQGYLRLDLVMASAFFGSVCGDQACFWIGRRFGRRWIERHPDKVPVIGRVARLLNRWGTWYVLSFRFLYGLRTVSPIAIGLTSISVLRFTVLNLIAAAIWAAAGSIAGYEFGDALEAGGLRMWEYRALAIVGIALATYTFYRLVRWYVWRRVPPP